MPFPCRFSVYFQKHMHQAIQHWSEISIPSSFTNTIISVEKYRVSDTKTLHRARPSIKISDNQRERVLLIHRIESNKPETETREIKNTKTERRYRHKR